jgi:hypothetical protein
MNKIIITILITFGITAIWQLLATRKIRANHRFMIQAVIKEMNDMAVKLGYEDFFEYLTASLHRPTSNPIKKPYH